MMRLTAEQTDTRSRLAQAQERFASLVYTSLKNRLKLRALMESRASGASETLPEVRLYRFTRRPPGYWKMMRLDPMRGGSDFPLDLRCERVPGGVILRAHGEIDLLTVPALREHLNKALETRQRVVVDLSSIDYIGVAGVRVLEEAQEAHTGRLAAIDSKPSVRRVMKILELDTVVPILPGRQAALEFLKA